MDEHGLRVLELPAILERLRGAAESEYGATLAEALRPSADAEEVLRRQALTAEAIALLDRSAEPSFAGIADVRADVARAARDGVLSPAELHRIAVAVRAALEARRVLAEADDAPLLRERAAAIEPGLAGVAD